MPGHVNLKSDGCAADNFHCRLGDAPFRSPTDTGEEHGMMPSLRLVAISMGWDGQPSHLAGAAEGLGIASLFLTKRVSTTTQRNRRWNFIYRTLSFAYMKNIPS